MEAVDEERMSVLGGCVSHEGASGLPFHRVRSAVVVLSGDSSDFILF